MTTKCNHLTSKINFLTFKFQYNVVIVQCIPFCIFEILRDEEILPNMDEANRNVFTFSEFDISDVMKREINLVMLPSIDDFYV